VGGGGQLSKERNGLRYDREKFDAKVVKKMCTGWNKNKNHSIDRALNKKTLPLGLGIRISNTIYE
jgi:hypothetical protein